MKIFYAILWSVLLPGFYVFGQWDTVQVPSQFYPTYLTENNGIMYCGENFGVHDYDGSSWTNLTQGTFQTSNNINAEIIFISNYIYVRTSTQGVYRSADGGTTWQMDTVGLTGAEKWSLFSDGTYIYLSEGWSSYSFYRKKPTEASWTQISTIGNNSALVYGLTMLNGNIYAAVSNGCWESTDNGVSWTKKISTNFPLETGNWHLQLAGNTFITHNDDLYFGSGNGIYKSSDNGDTWARIDVGFTSTFGATTIQALYSDGVNLYASTRNSSNAYKSSDNGVTWADISNGLSGKVISFVSYSGSIYATLFGKRNIYKLGGGTSPTYIEEESPSFLVEVFPNPFSSDATFLITGKDYNNTSVVLSDITGKTVRSFSVENGNTFVINREGLDSGVYFYQLIEQNKTLVQGKIIIK